MPDGVRRDPRIIALDEIGSTNAYAMDLARKGEAGPLWVTARHQTDGRGRSGRVWQSVDGNLYASLLIVLACSPREIQHLSLVSGVAVHDAVTAAANACGQVVSGLRLKWPNDVLAGGAKIAGILPESTTAGGGALAVVIGVGLNLAAAPSHLAGQAAALADFGITVSPELMISHLDSAFADRLAAWNLGAGFAVLREAWLARAGAPGEAISVNVGSGPLRGTFGGLDPDGALLLRDVHGAIRRFTYGDVTIG